MKLSLPREISDESTRMKLKAVQLALLNYFVLILNEASFFVVCEVTVRVILGGLITVLLERS